MSALMRPRECHERLEPFRRGAARHGFAREREPLAQIRGLACRGDGARGIEQDCVPRATVGTGEDRADDRRIFLRTSAAK